MTDQLYSKIFKKIKEASKIFLVTHDRPDGDAVSSVCVLIELLESMGKSYFAYCYDQPPYQFKFLPHIEKITNDKAQFNFADFDLIIILDCGGLNRTKLSDEINNHRENQFVIEIDHHPKIDHYADIEVCDLKASSTTEVLYYFFKANKIKFNKDIANCLLTGIVTDTAFFLYPATSDKTVEIASEMLAKGARLPQIMENTWRNKSLASMKIWGKALTSLKINSKYNFAFSVLTLSDIKESGAQEEELEGISGFLSNLQGTKGVLLLREEDGIIKGSLRTSDPGIDISSLARELGGGGHAKASGFIIEGRLQKIDDKWKVI